MTTVIQLREILDRRFSGVLKAGKHSEDGEAPARTFHVKATTDKSGLNIIDRGVMLYLARNAIMEPDTPALYGQALVAFAKAYVQGESLKNHQGGAP